MRIGLLSTSICATVLHLISATAANAAYVLEFKQVGANVVATGSGTMAFSDQVFQSFAIPLSVGVNPSIGYVAVGNQNASGDPENYGDYFSPLTGPASFGTGGFTAASSTSGTVAGISGTAGLSIYPGGYPSGGSMISSVTTWNNATIAGLGLTAGTYSYNLGNIDTFTINISGVPEASTWAMMLIGFAGLGFASYRATRKSMALAG